jgi:hypothetical protein
MIAESVDGGCRSATAANTFGDLEAEPSLAPPPVSDVLRPVASRDGFRLGAVAVMIKKPARSASHSPHHIPPAAPHDPHLSQQINTNGILDATLAPPSLALIALGRPVHRPVHCRDCRRHERPARRRPRAVSALG